MKILNLEVKVHLPDLVEVEAPIRFGTPIGDCSTMSEVRQVQQLIEYLQRLPEIEFIINADHQHIRHPFCRELVRDRLRFIHANVVWHVGEALAHFLMSFRKMSGLKFSEYKFKFQQLGTGKVYKVEGRELHFLTVDEAYRHYTEVALHNKEAEFKVLED